MSFLNIGRKGERYSLFILLVTGVVLAFHPTLFSGFTRIQTDPGDNRYCNYILEHSFRWISGFPLHQSFWDAPFFFPVRNVTSYSELFLGSAPVYWIWRWVGFLPATSFQLWMISVSILNFLAMYLVIRKGLGLDSLSASFGSFLFGFASYRVVQIEHPQLLPHFFSCLMIFSMIQLAKSKRGFRSYFWAVGSALSLVLQFYAGFYLGWFTSLGLLFFAVFAVSSQETRQLLVVLLSKHWKAILAAMIIALFLFFPLVSHYLQVASTLGTRTVREVMEPQLQSWVYMGGRSWLFSWQTGLHGFRIIDSGEQKLGVGILALCLSIIGLQQKSGKQPWVRIMGIAFLAIFICVTRLHSVALWPLLFPVIPGATAIRSLSRVGLLFLFPLSIGLAYFVQRYRNWKYIGVVIVFCVLEQAQTTASFDKEKWDLRVKKVTAKIAPDCQAFFYSPTELLPASPSEVHHEIYLQLDAMWASLEAGRKGIPTINGYSGNSPLGWTAVSNPTQAQTWLLKWSTQNGLEPDRICLIQ